MLFSSNIFLFAFLPACLLGYYLIKVFAPRFRNAFLFLMSCFFYFWGSGQIAILFLAAVFVNHMLAKLIDRSPPKKARLIFWAGVGYNLAWLLYFKYLNFFYDNLAALFAWWGISLPAITQIALPVGISFYTFQCIAYLSEAYQREHKPARSWLDYGTYLAFFPHVVAGPIVRYSDIDREIRERAETLNLFFEGIWRFALGLGKKVIIANTLGAVADQLFALPSAELNPVKAWTGALCYTFQIYFDFSGYSDMAIGLARMFGFHFPENFNQPYRSQSVTEFWRRWHMTMSNWFRDFVYIPLGGNRLGARRTYGNLWIVFFLCGLWHGAAWTFVVWGMWHGLLLVGERWAKTRFGWTPKGIPGTGLTFLLVVIGWVPFRADSLSHAGMFISRMFSIAVEHSANDLPIWFYLTPDVWFCLALAMIFSWLPTEKFQGMRLPEPMTVLVQGSVSVLLFIYCAATLSKVAFNPFIYFRF
ncbi:MAG: hypothetical protein RIS36_1276 [Pseudomonadota bacterium]|jgi:alginate O-acetyltransferase complex protein AlgI